jgi:hypothetical protein
MIYKKYLSMARAVIAFAFCATALSSLSTVAHAQSGSRICMNEAKTYVFEIKSNNHEKSVCRNGNEVNTTTGNWGNGSVMTCESFAQNYLNWDWDVCQEMPRKRLILDTAYSILGPEKPKFEVSDNQVFKITGLQRTLGMNTANACGADSCTLNANQGRSTTFGYTAGAGVSLGDVFSYNVSFSASYGSSSGMSYSCTYYKGHEGGMQIMPNDNNVNSSLNYAALFGTTDCFTRGHSDRDKNKVLGINSCPVPTFWSFRMMKRLENGTQYAPEKVHFLGGTPITNYQLDDVAYGEADQLYSQLLDNKYNYAPLLFERTGRWNLVDIACGVRLDLDTDPLIWRGGNDGVKWKVGMLTARGWEAVK